MINSMDRNSGRLPCGRYYYGALAAIAAATLLLCLSAGLCFILRPAGADGGLCAAVAAAALVAAGILSILTVRGIIVRRAEIRKLVEITKDSPRFPKFTNDIGRYVFDLIDAMNQSAESDSNYLLLQKQAELGVMQNQINPHFLYNTLECLRGLALMQGAEETADMAQLLSRLYRYYISSGSDMQPIEKELQCVDNYIKIQQYRFPNRFVLINNIDYSDRGVMEYRIPKLTLQPIIENIIHHAFSTRLGDNRIRLDVEKTQSRLILIIEDNGNGMDEATLNKLNERFVSPETELPEQDTKSSGTGIALSNINMRIRIIFGNSYGLIAFSSPGLGTQIRIELPLEEPLYE